MGEDKGPLAAVQVLLFGFGFVALKITTPRETTEDEHTRIQKQSFIWVHYKPRQGPGQAGNSSKYMDHSQMSKQTDSSWVFSDGGPMGTPHPDEGLKHLLTPPGSLYRHAHQELTSVTLKRYPKCPFYVSDAGWRGRPSFRCCFSFLKASGAKGNPEMKGVSFSRQQ
ncbi:hypothetical protein STEG23_007088, partial [Scotinomys teguina]